MEFNKSKVFSGLNGTETTAGSIGYFADTIKQLEQYVIDDSISMKLTLKSFDEDKLVFFSDEDITEHEFNFFYEVERKNPEVERLVSEYDISKEDAEKIVKMGLNANDIEKIADDFEEVASDYLDDEANISTWIYDFINLDELGRCIVDDNEGKNHYFILDDKRVLVY